MNAKKQGGMGSGGYCVCVQCGVRVPHRRGVPCLDERCPKCGRALLREGGEHHRRATSPKKA
jgi:NAD-dependent SIR2 family protein deacetylase